MWRLVAVALVVSAGLGYDRARAAGAKFGFEQGGRGAGAKDIRPQDVIQWDGFQALEERDGKVTAQLRLTSRQDWKIYASNLKFSAPPGFIIDAQHPPPSHRFLDPITGHEVDVYDGGEFTLTLSGAPRWRGPKFPITVTYVGCTNVICLFPYSAELSLNFTPFAADDQRGMLAPAPVLAPAPPNAGGEDVEEQLARKFRAGGLSFSVLLLLVFAGGLLSNLTPCVAPMIPITMRLLARQGHSPFASAFAYACGIVVTYGTLGMAAALSGGMFGALMASKAFNIVFAVIMALLGTTMLGYGDFSYLQSLGTRLGTGRPSAANALLMGVGAGFVAAPCTGPILAALLTYTAQNNAGVLASAALLGTYSIGFALPYVALGGAAARVSSLRVPAKMQVLIKVVFAAAMFGLAFYYLRVPLYSLVEGMRGRWALALLGTAGAGAILTVAWLVIPTLQEHKSAALMPAVVLGFALFSLSQWSSAPKVAAGVGGEHGFTTYTNEQQALAAAANTGKPLLIDFWAEWCEACKKMDATTFADPDVIEALAKHWTVLKLDLTESTAANDALQAKFDIQSLPTLILLPADGSLSAKTSVRGFVGAQGLLAELRQFSSPKP